MMREWLELKLEVLTPAFISGADQKEAEFRSASVKGLLRWWWRASVGHEADLGKLRDREAALFGSAEEGLKSPLHVVVREVEPKRMDRALELPRSGHQYRWVRRSNQGSSDVLPYIAYGPVRLLTRDEKTDDGRAKDPAFNSPDGRALKGPRLMRSAIAPGTELAVRLIWQSGRLTETQRDEVARAACAWTSLGGIGSRSRKGWGLLEGVVQSASSSSLLDNAQSTWNSFRSSLVRNGRQLPAGRLPDFPQLEYRMIFMDRQSFAKWEQALGSIGLHYKQLRPRGDGRWIAGEADPRRASSVFISMIRDPDRKLRGLLCLLPCRRDPTDSGENELRSFIAQFAKLGTGRS